MLLEQADLDELPAGLEVYAPASILSYLIGAFLHRDEIVRWKAIHAFGITVARLAGRELERAKVVVRRLMWMLNEESGGMAWGVGEGFAEALYHSARLKDDYLQIYLSYIWPEGNYLEFPPAQRGFAWGVGRLVQRYEKEVYELAGHEHLFFHLESSDLNVVFLSLWSLSQFKSALADSFFEDERCVKALKRLKDVNWQVLLFDGQSIRVYTPKDLALL